MVVVSPRRLRARRGLTLMELVVVLVILIALAGILIPLLPSMLGRAETASGATSQTEIVKWIQTYEQLRFQYPQDWDSLTDASGTFLQTGFVRGGGEVISDSGGLSAAEAGALIGAGIGRLQAMTATPANKTFDPYGNADYDLNKITPAAATKFVILDVTGQKRLGLARNGTADAGKFVVFGFGNRASIIGKTTSNAPVVFRDDGNKSPDKVYCRYGVVFQVSINDGVKVTPLDRARFVGVCNFKGDHIATSDEDLEEFYDLNRGGS